MAYQLSATNGGAIADASGSFDMLTKLINFVTGVSSGEAGFLLPTDQRWEVMRDDTVTIPGQRIVTLRGPGLSGADNIYVSIQAYTDGSNVHNWRVGGATGFVPGTGVQPGRSTIVTYLTFSNANMPFWFVANGRRIILVFATSGSVSYAGYLGWYLPYATPAEWPYPMFIGGSTASSTVGFSDTSYQVGNFYDGPSRLTSGASGHVRHSDGTWLPVSSYVGANISNRASLSENNTNVFWPHDLGNSTPTNYGYNLVENSDASFPVLPFVLYSLENNGNIYGELDGVYFSPWGTTPSKTFPDTITIVSDTYLVINNAYRTSEANAVVLLK